MITKEMTIAEALEEGNKMAMASVLQSVGMHCLGCALSSGETVEEAAQAHGVEVEALIIALTEAAKK